MRKAFCILMVLTLFALQVKAWNDVGHRAVAELAWRKLSKKERQAASDLLKQHPHYGTLLASNVPKGVDTNEWVFLTAAVWPDMIKPSKSGPPKADSIAKYDLYPHAIGYPFVRPADSNAVSLKDFYIAKPNAEMVLSNSIATLKDRKASAHDRAVSLCWAMHLMGDLHQPLHAATWVRKDKKEWDGLGGNYVVMDPHGEPLPKRINMHSYWDGLGGVDPSYQTVSSLLDQISNQDHIESFIRTDYRKHRTIASWVQESYRLAVDFAYAEDRVQFVHKDDPAYGNLPDSAIPVLKEEYINGARVIAHRRILLAGWRLTDELKRVW